MHNESRASALPLALLAAASGARAWAGVAALEPRSIVPVFAAGELVLDKIPSMPPRIDGLSILGRIAAFAVIGTILGRRTRGDPIMLAGAGATLLRDLHEQPEP